ncbi:unnamed protein product [Enterobius vermicularis]|uniref:NPC1_N domain-containing protein n=1 Tax=Enterobius vermicularis TaxID=51028 RepID=A0A0N4UU05_ENTVE|nr:unnamed protein product [Enterobius vermicularis]
MIIDPIFSPRRCVMRGACGFSNGLVQNCPYDGPPLPLTNRTLLDDLQQYCPHLFRGRIILEEKFDFI